MAIEFIEAGAVAVDVFLYKPVTIESRFQTIRA